MSIKSFIQDGEGTGITAGVTGDKALKVTNIPLSIKEALETENSYFIDSDNNSNVNIDSSTDCTDYCIVSEESRLKSIYYIKFILEDQMMYFGSSEGKRFASAAGSGGLTNGISMFTEQQGLSNDIFVEPIKSIADFMKYSEEIVNEPDAVGSGDDLLVVKINFVRPINIIPGEIDKIVVRINDDLSSIDYFKIIASGIQETVE
jgi:hypothetical protein